MLLQIALKEWDLVIRDLLAGRQSILLRKGGILESENQFTLEHPRFLFYPTFIHQDPKMVKPQRLADIRALPAEPEKIELTAYGHVAHIFEVPRQNARQRVDSLADLHPFSPALIDMRFNYRPEKPLFIVLVRAFHLPAPISIPNTPEYAGCKSWIPLEHPIDTTGATPAIPDPAFSALQARLASVLAP